MGSDNIWALGDLDECEAGAVGIASGVELGGLVVLCMEEGIGAVGVAMADLPRAELFKLLLLAVNALASPSVLRSLAADNDGDTS